MNYKWILTDCNISSTLKLCFTLKSFSLYVENETIVSNYSEEDLIILIDGYVLPRNTIFQKYSQLTQFELVIALYQEYNVDFVNKIKGFFTVVIFRANEIVVVNDIHSVKRFFVHTTPKGVILSNDFSIIKKMGHVINPYAPAVQAVLQHFVNGLTPFQDIVYSRPASLYHFKEEKWVIKKYYDHDYYLTCERDKTSMEGFIHKFYESINNTIKYLNPNSISTTLTGGRDTRSILAGLLKAGVNPHCFTFGYPTGIDVITAKEVTSKLNIKYSNYFIENINADSYKKLVDEIVIIGNPFIHLHRAHRLDAIEKEKDFHNGELDMVFVGAMGGDYIKGEGFNDYIITEFLRLYLTAVDEEDVVIKDILKKHFIEPTNDIIEYIKSLLSSMNLKYGVFNKYVEFNLVQNIIGSTHDIQDINVFMEHAKYVIAPFMDIDVMEALFTSYYSMFSNTRHTINPFKRLKGGELQSVMIKNFSPDLAKINFANQYSPNDILGNRYFYVLKRIYLHVFKNKSKPTFLYGEWMKEFVKNELLVHKAYVESHYNYNSMVESLEKQTHLHNEGYWHKYSNPINLAMYL